VRTVEGHLYRIFAKLGIDDRDQLVHLLRQERSGELNAKVILPPGQR
jgi:DNA-binding NarL/FixJ family response regulator